MPFLAHIVITVEIGTLIVGGIRYRFLPRPLRILEWLIIFNVAVGISEFVIAYSHSYNLWVAHISTVVEYIFLFFVFFLWISSHKSKLILLICLFIFITLWVLSKFTFEPFSTADDLTSAISKLLQIFFSVYLLIDVINESDIIWTKDPRIWVAAGIIIYAAGSLFMFALFNKMLQIYPDRLKLIWSLNWVLMIISNLFYIRGFLCKE